MKLLESCVLDCRRPMPRSGFSPIAVTSERLKALLCLQGCDIRKAPCNSEPQMAYRTRRGRGVFIFYGQSTNLISNLNCIQDSHD